MTHNPTPAAKHARASDTPSPCGQLAGASSMLHNRKSMKTRINETYRLAWSRVSRNTCLLVRFAISRRLERETSQAIETTRETTGQARQDGQPLFHVKLWHTVKNRHTGRMAGYAACIHGGFAEAGIWGTLRCGYARATASRDQA